MDAQVFWNVIASYNSATVFLQGVILLLVVVSVILSCTGRIPWLAKTALGAVNLYIAVGFFFMYGTQSIQKYFALPLFMLIGLLFLYESVHNQEDALEKPRPVQICLLALFVLYPVISLALGNTFPRIVTYVMPCPIVSLSIVVYLGYQKKNRLLMILLAILGITGVKSIAFRAYEDIILLTCGVYAIYLTICEYQQNRAEEKTP